MVEVEPTRKEIETAKQNVLRILKEHPATRNDDKILLFEYWRQVDQIKDNTSEVIPFIPYSEMKRATPIETITRVRRLIQESGKYSPTDPKVLEMRMKRRRKFRKIMQLSRQKGYSE